MQESWEWRDPVRQGAPNGTETTAEGWLCLWTAEAVRNADGWCVSAWNAGSGALEGGQRSFVMGVMVGMGIALMPLILLFALNHRLKTPKHDPSLFH